MARPRHRFRPTEPSPTSDTQSQRRSRTTIENLSDKILREIFRYYLDTSPRLWPRLVHICRKWRRIICASQQALHPRPPFLCGTRVQKSLDFWPAQPFVVENGGSLALDTPAPEDEDDILAARNQSDRTNPLSVCVTSSLPGNCLEISRPFWEPEDLDLLSRESGQLTLPISFRLGLRHLHLTRVALLPLLQLLSYFNNLVDLQLHQVLNPWHLSPEALASALSGMAQLQSLSLYLLPTDIHVAPPPSPSSQVVLPILTRFNFGGISEYLEGLVSRINAPRLGDIELTFFNETVTDLSHLNKFISRIEMHRSHSLSHILSSENGISFSLMQPRSPTCLKFHLFREPLRQQLSFIGQICSHFPTFLSNVEDLHIIATRPSGWTSGLDGNPWFELTGSFTDVKRLHVSGNLSIDIVRFLQHAYSFLGTMPPALHKLSISQPGPRHAPLREAILSVMVSSRLSGHPIAVEYEREPCHISKIPAAGPFSHQKSIDMLTNDALLDVFRHYLDATSRNWLTLTWVCQRWRQIVYSSPMSLNLQLHCTYGKPVLETLHRWPAIPIFVQYGGSPNLDPPACEDNGNIIAALERSNCVRTISLTVTNSLLEKLPAISEPFSELETLTLLSQDDMQLALPNAFRWGSRLRTLRSTRIAFLSFPQLLLPSQGLVELQLCEIPAAGYFPPESFANALSGMTQLKELSLHFLSLPSRRTSGWSPLSEERIVLPALKRLKYRGTSKYLNSFVARIDAPSLAYIDITFFNQPTMDALELGRFFGRIELRTSLIQADVETSEDAISISFTNSSASRPLRLRIPCKLLNWQLSGMAQVCDRISPFLFYVNNLGISTAERPSCGEDDVDWLALVDSFKFGGAKSFWIAGELTTDILCALGPTDGGNANMLPSLRHLRVREPLAMYGASWDAARSFIALRWLSNRPVQVNAPSYLCHICRGTFKQSQGLRGHLSGAHSYRILCSYCGDFECMPGNDDLFRGHLQSEHPEVAHNDALISKLSLTRLQIDSLFNRHSSLRAPPPSTPVTEPHSPIVSDPDSPDIGHPDIAPSDSDADHSDFDADQSNPDADHSDSDTDASDSDAHSSVT